MATPDDARQHDNDEPNRPDDSPSEDEFTRQIRDFMKNANIQFGFMPGGQGGDPAGTSASEAPDEDAEARETLEKIRTFNLRPRELRDYLNRYVIKQHEAKKVLSVAICDHYNHVRRCLEEPDLKEREYRKPNILLMGPTGVGKTYLMRCIARHIGVPFVKADATKFSETGYVGYDVEDIVRDLVKMAGGNTDLAQYGIIYIDEIDKIAGRGGGDGQASKDVSGRGVQINLLKLMEETDVNLFSQTDILGQMQAVMDMQRGGGQKQKSINTRHMLFIVSGAFDALGEVVRKRVGTSAIGFGHEGGLEEKEDTESLKQAEAQDFITYGYEPEFIGRLPIRVACEPLRKGDLEEILLKSEDSVLDQFRGDFRGYGIEFDITREAIGAIAERAAGEKTGARGLMTTLETLFRDYKFELPSTAIRHFEVTRETIGDPTSSLKDLLLHNSDQQQKVLMEEVQSFANRFHEQHGLRLDFDADAVEALVSLSLEQDKTIRALCEERFRDYEFGLKLIHERTGRDRFTITRDAVENPDGELSKWVVEQYPDTSRDEG